MGAVKHAPLILAIALVALSAVASAEEYGAEVFINSSGIVSAVITGNVTVGVNEIRVPVPPMVETLEVTVNGKLLAPIFENGTLYVFSNAQGAVRISYLALVAETPQGTLAFNVTGNTTIKLFLDPNVVLLTVPTNLLDAWVEGNRLVMVLRGPETVEYVLRAPPTAPATPTPPPETATTAQTPPPARTETVGKVRTATSAIPMLPMVVAAALVMGLAGAAIAILRRGRGGSPSPTPLLEGTALDKLDSRILEELKSRGGSMLQSELLRALGMPKSTVWRHVKKLERMGLVRVQKEPSGVNRVFLKGGE